MTIMLKNLKEQESVDALWEEMTLIKEEPADKFFYPPWYGFRCEVDVSKRYSQSGLMSLQLVYSTTFKGKKRKPFQRDITYKNTDGKFHRIYGPAIISRNYDFEIWYRENQLHRTDGPALRHKNLQIWAVNGSLHRLDGPAVVSLSGPREYWIEGRPYNKKEYEKEINRRRRIGKIID